MIFKPYTGIRGNIDHFQVNYTKEKFINMNASHETDSLQKELGLNLSEVRATLKKLTAEERLFWAEKTFQKKFALTTSFGIQSAVLLHMIKKIKNYQEIPIIWIDTGYLPSETYCYAEQLITLFKLNVVTTQSNISPARMEALYGKLWETNSMKDLEKYLQIRKVEPLESAMKSLGVNCWASGVRGSQTQHRSSMSIADPIRNRLSIRPLLKWSKKDIFYYMKDNNLPQHPLFEKGYSSVGDWHSSSPEGESIKGRETRFGGRKQECGIHLPGVMGEGI